MGDIMWGKPEYMCGFPYTIYTILINILIII